MRLFQLMTYSSGAPSCRLKLAERGACWFPAGALRSWRAISICAITLGTRASLAMSFSSSSSVLTVRLPLLVGPGATGAVASRNKARGEDGEVFAQGRIDLACAGEVAEQDGRNRPGGGRTG